MDRLFDDRAIVGMVHLPPLPGAPRYEGDRERLRSRAVRDAVSLPVGMTVLRNDAESAVSVAAATGASFVRVNVHAGARVTDQGVVAGRSHETLRLRERLDADVRILADVAVKHSAPLDRPCRTPSIAGWLTASS